MRNRPPRWCSASPARAGGKKRRLAPLEPGVREQHEDRPGRACRVWRRARHRGREGRRSRSLGQASVPSGSARIARLQGRLAQLGEHQLDKLGVTGSSPVPPTPAISLLERVCGAEEGAPSTTDEAARQAVALRPRARIGWCRSIRNVSKSAYLGSSLRWTDCTCSSSGAGRPPDAADRGRGRFDLRDRPGRRAHPPGP